jgi:hypothetical protein
MAGCGNDLHRWHDAVEEIFHSFGRNFGDNGDGMCFLDLARSLYRLPRDEFLTAEHFNFMKVTLTSSGSHLIAV